MQATQAYISGEWLDSELGKTFPVLDPASGKTLAEVQDCGGKIASFAIEAAHEAFLEWKKTSAREKSQVLMKIRDHILKNLEELATVMTQECGKPIQESRVEVNFSASFFEWFAAEARRDYGDTIPAPAQGKHIITLRQPVGVAAFITPWNFPLGMLARKVSAALAAGCTCVIKPAEDTPLCALMFVQICHEAGVPPGLVNIVPCSRNNVVAVGEMFCTHRKVACISFTGSTSVGKWLYAKAATSMKRIHMELGGNAPFIVFNDADLDGAVAALMAAKFRNAGQACVAANRILVQSEVFESFLEKFVAAVEKLKVGPGIEGCDIGPLINDKQLERMEKIVADSIANGARVVSGGGRLPALGPRFYKPVVLVNVKPGMSLYDEEIFGPVASLTMFDDEDEAIHMANDTDMGLSAFAFTNNLRLSWKLAESLEYGMVGINEPLLSTCEAPFGGIKQSGFGREGSKYGLEEYTYVKYIGYGVQSETA